MNTMTKQTGVTISDHLVRVLTTHYITRYFVLYVVSVNGELMVDKTPRMFVQTRPPVLFLNGKVLKANKLGNGDITVDYDSTGQGFKYNFI